MLLDFGYLSSCVRRSRTTRRVLRTLFVPSILTRLKMAHSIFLTAAILATIALCSGNVVSPRWIEGILDCGSQSELVDTRFDGCNEVPCRTEIGNTYRAEVDFRPHFRHEKLRLSIVLIQAPEHHEVIDVEVPDSAIEAGVSYTFGYNVAITGAFMDDALMAFNLVGDGPAGREVICLGITLHVPRD